MLLVNFYCVQMEKITLFCDLLGQATIALKSFLAPEITSFPNDDGELAKEFSARELCFLPEI